MSTIARYKDQAPATAAVLRKQLVGMRQHHTAIDATRVGPAEQIQVAAGKSGSKGSHGNGQDGFLTILVQSVWKFAGYQVIHSFLMGELSGITQIGIWSNGSLTFFQGFKHP